jgi:tetratricopeptide (TPR) repeat protein
MKNTLTFTLLITIILGFSGEVFSQQTQVKQVSKPSTFDLKKNASLFVEANKEKNAGNIAVAELLYLECIKLDPMDAASMYELASIYMVSNKLEEAKKLANKATEIDPNNSWYKLLLANIYKRSESYSESVEVLEELVKQNPNNLEFIEELAYNYILIGENKKAIKALNIIEDKIGISEQLTIQKQKLFINLNQIDSAIFEIEKLIKEFPLEVRYYALLAELCLQNNFDEKAFLAYSKIAELDPGNAYIHISLSDFYRKAGDSINAFKELKLGFENENLDVDSKIQILLSYFTAQQIINERNEKAFELVSILVDKYPDNTRVLSIKAEILYQAREFKNSKILLLKIIEIDSLQFAAWEQLLIAESALTDFENLEKHSLKAIQLFPLRPIAYLFAGMVSFQNKKHDEALSFYKKGIKLVSGNTALSVQFYSFLGDTYHELKNNIASDEAYENALRLDPENAVVLNNYAYYLSLRSEKLEQAKRMSFKAVELDPENASNLDTKAWVLYKLKLYDEAKIVIELALNASEENSAEVYEHYGDILYMLGNKKKAIKFWKRARKKGSESELLSKKIRDKKLYD